MSANNTDILITYDNTTTTMSIDLSGLAPATYTGSVAYTDTSGKSTTATVALTISQSVPTPPPPPPPPVESGNPYGGGWIGGLASAQSGLFAVIDKSKASVVRYQCKWLDIETSPGVYDWSTTDDLVKTAQANKLLIVFPIQNAPPFAAVPLVGTSHMIPDPKKIGPFVDALTRHYPPGTFHALEINNEGYSTGTVLLSQFTTQLLPSLQAVRPIIEQNTPGTLLGGPADLNDNPTNTVTWWQYFYQAGCHTFCDYLNFHFYPGSSPDDSSATHASLSQRIKAITDQQAAHQDTRRPVWITETGWKRLNAAGTNGGVDPTTLGGYITTLLTESMNSGVVKRVIYFDLNNIAPGQGSNQNFSLPCYTAWEGFIAAHPQW